MESSYDPHLGFSFVYILVTCTLTWIMRFAIREFFPDPTNQYRILALEVFSTFEKIACAFEFQIVLAENGVPMYVTVLVMVNFWFNLTWEPTKSWMPRHIENLAEGKVTWGQLMSRLCTELLAGLLVYPLFIKHIWTLYDNHLFRRDKLHTAWTADLHVSPLKGSLVEFSGILACTFMTKLLRELFRSQIVISLLCSVFAGITIVLGMNSSGAYYDPVFASTMQFGSPGVTLFEHIQVYWIFPILGSFCGYLLFRGAKSALGFTNQKHD